MSGLQKIGTTRASFDHIEIADFIKLPSPPPRAFFSTMPGKIVLGCVASIGGSVAIISAASFTPITSSTEHARPAAVVATPASDPTSAGPKVHRPRGAPPKRPAHPHGAGTGVSSDE